MDTINYKEVRDAYKQVQNSDEIYKSREYYTSIDTSSGGYSEGSKVAGRIMNDLNRLDMRGELCGSFEARLQYNNHDLGGYYSVEIYSVELEVDDDSELYNIVCEYQDRGREQIEAIIAKYSV